MARRALSDFTITVIQYSKKHVITTVVMLLVSSKHDTNSQVGFNSYGKFLQWGRQPYKFQGSFETLESMFGVTLYEQCR